MIVIYINGEGTAEKLSPQHVYQGSNQTGVAVFAPVPSTTSMGIAFQLPDGTSTPYYPMTPGQSVDRLMRYEYTIPSSITQNSGCLAIAIQMIFSDGEQTSQRIDIEIEKSILPVLPDEPTPDVYKDLLQYTSANSANISTLQGQIGHIEELSESAENASQNAVQTANEAKATADGLADSIAQANTNAQNAVDTADGAVKDIAEYKASTDSEIAEFKQNVTQEVSQFESGVNTAIDNFKGDVNGEVSEFKSSVTQEITQFESGVNDKLDKFEEQLSDTGTIVKVDGTSEKEIAFISDPQTQINELGIALNNEVTARENADAELQNSKVNKSGDTMTGDLTIDKPSNGARFIAKTAKNGEGIQIGVNGDDASTGIWDLKRNKWIMQNRDGTIYVDGTSINTFLKTDPAKLQPTTENGWTIGKGDSLQLPNTPEGVYLLAMTTGSNSISTGVPMLAICSIHNSSSLATRYDLTCIGIVPSATRYMITCSYTIVNGKTSSSWSIYNISSGSPTSVDNSSINIAYKKLA